ncbi:DNA N-6-adenine-methyltransferase [Clavibacter sp. Sh2088]|uniref:DNA N-6-adenine-methyltransferase n=1 Tax=Clavibacter sp. Sh2088 TaxID=3397676 RepID=UPI0039E12CB9
MTAGRQALSLTKDWTTPPDILASVRKVFKGQIGLDPCSNEHSLVDAQIEYRLPERDGLNEPWEAETIFVNPPYGSDKERGTRIAHWFAKIGEAAAAGSEVLALVPVATNTGHWKQFVYPVAAGICFLYAPRLRFYINGREDPKGAPMSCAVVYYGHDFDQFAEAFRVHGAVIPLEKAVLPREPTLMQKGRPRRALAQSLLEDEVQAEDILVDQGSPA